MKRRLLRPLAILVTLLCGAAATSSFLSSVLDLSYFSYALPPDLANQAPDTKVTLCTQVHNDMPYLVEYIEFMKIMGVARFIICNERSDDDLDLLQELYESRGRTYVTVIPSPEPGTLMDGQVACYEQCFRMAKDDTDWFIAIDDDEFAVPVAYDTIPEYLDSLEPDLGQVTAWEVRYGTGGAKDRFRNSLTRGLDGALVYSNPRGTLQLVTQEHLRRQPKEEFGWQLPGETSWEVRALPSPQSSPNPCYCAGLRDRCGHTSNMAMFPNCSRKACNDYPTCSGTQAFCNETAEGVSTWDLCINGLSKSVSRTEATEDLSLHTNHMKPGWRSIDSDSTGLVSWHHYLRTAEDAWLKHNSWMKCDPVDILHDVDDSFFSHVEDRRFLRYGAELRKRLADFTS